MKHLVIITGPYFPTARVYKNLSEQKIAEIKGYLNTIPVYSHVEVFEELPQVIEFGDFKFYLKDQKTYEMNI